MAIGATNIVAPMLTTTKVVVFLAARMTGQTGFGNLLRRFVLEGDDLGGIAFVDVGLAWTMTRFTAGHFRFPTADLRQFCVRRMRERFELVFVTGFAGLSADIVVRLVGSDFDGANRRRLR